MVIGLLSLCNVSTVLAASPVTENKPAASSEQKPSAKKTTPTQQAPAAKKKPQPLKSGRRRKSPSQPGKWHRPSCHRRSWTCPCLSDMVRHLQPLGTMPKPKSVPLLPPMFGEKPTDNSAFQINGRLLSNEMKLQLRNEERREVEGAALEFEFKQ